MLPMRKGQPMTALVSLIGTGTPSRAPFGCPFCQRASDSRAMR